MKVQLTVLPWSVLTEDHPKLTKDRLKSNPLGEGYAPQKTNGSVAEMTVRCYVDSRRLYCRTPEK